MKCNLHYDREVVNFCNQCNAPLCIECNEKYGGLCRSCLSSWVKKEKKDLFGFLIPWFILLAVVFVLGIWRAVSTPGELLEKIVIFFITIIFGGFWPFGIRGLEKMRSNHVWILPIFVWLIIAGFVIFIGFYFGWLFAIPELYSMRKRYKNVMHFNEILNREKMIKK